MKGIGTSAATNRSTTQSRLVPGGGSAGEFDVGARPEVAEVADGQAQRDAHLAGHDDEGHVPAADGDHE